MRVSVIVPVLDAEPYLGQALGSVLEQTLAPHEVIVVDDGSTDGSLLTARRFAAAFPDRVRVVAGRTGRASRARNLGASLATGDALMFLDADDVIEPDTLAVLAHALETHPGGIAACPWFRLDLVDGDWVQRPASCRPRRPGQDALEAWLSGWYHPPCSVLWSREAFERAGRWDELCTVNDDGDLMMRALVLGLPLMVQQAGAAYYRRHPPGAIPSLSGLRTTRAGLESQLRVLQKIAVWLEEQGKAESYRQALAEAAHRLALDAEPFPDLVFDAALLGAPRRAGPHLSVRAPARALGPLVRRVRGRARAARRALRPRRREPSQQVLHGTAAAARAASADPATARCLDPPHAPLVSVIVPTYQRAHVLPRTLRTVLAQTMDDLEVLVVDDGSTDGTASLMVGHDRRVRYIPQPQNQGVSAARNRGLREARGQFIAFLDSDDEWMPDKLERQVQRMRELPESVGVVYTGVTDDDGASRRTVRVPQHRGDVHRALLERNVVHGTSSVVMRRSVVPATGFFDERIPAIEDYDYWLRASRWFEFDYVSDPLIVYHDPHALERKSRQLEQNLDARAYFYRKHEHALRDAGLAASFLLGSARRHLRNDYDVLGARALARQAWRLAPRSADVHMLLLKAHLPRTAVRLRWRLRAAGGRSGHG